MSLAASLESHLCRSGPWGFKSGPGCGTITAIVSQTDLRILRDVPSGKPWPAEDTRRTRRGWMLLFQESHVPRAARLRPPRRHRSEHRHVGFPAKAHRSPNWLGLQFLPDGSSGADQLDLCEPRRSEVVRVEAGLRRRPAVTGLRLGLGGVVSSTLPRPCLAGEVLAVR